jgi:hypothetical protein
MSDAPKPRAGSRRTVFLVLLLFAAPLAAAFWLYYGSSWRPALHTNHGTLITPPVTLSEGVLHGKWTLLVVGHGESGCDAPCRDTLIYARQTWLSLAQLTPRVQRVLLAGSGCCDTAYLQREHSGLITLDAASPTAPPMLPLLPKPTAGTIFVVDPLGNLMMRYDVRQDPKGLREDLKKLLELSHIG